MYDYDRIVRDRQKAVRREIDRRELSIKALYLDAGWENSSTLLSYFPADQEREPATMSLASFYRLFKALPTDLLSFMLPEGFAVVRVPEGLDHDEIDRAFRDYTDAKAAAHHPESECGRDLGPKERAALDDKIVRLPIKGRVG